MKNCSLGLSSLSIELLRHDWVVIAHQLYCIHEVFSSEAVGLSMTDVVAMAFSQFTFQLTTLLCQMTSQIKKFSDWLNAMKQDLHMLTELQGITAAIQTRQIYALPYSLPA